jgi:hypothetical protein
VPPLTTSRFFLIVAFVFFVIDACAAGGVLQVSDTGWLLPGGLAAATLGALLG